MTARSVIQRDKEMLRKWLGTNRGTHWTVAGSVAVIIFGSYLIYRNSYGKLTNVPTIPAAERSVAPIAPGPLTSKSEIGEPSGLTRKQNTD